MKLIKSCMNYTGGKQRLLPQILPLFPEKIDTFVDLFCGGCSVGLNVRSERVVFNDSQREIIELYRYLSRTDIRKIQEQLLMLIDQYGLSMVSEHGYDYYHCSSADGLADYNREKYMQLRKDFNDGEDFHPLLFYLLIVYGFNNQVRFNSRKKFNLPVGKRDFNRSMQEKLEQFVEQIQKGNYMFTSRDFRSLDLNDLGPDDFVYLDPPYFISTAAYNENSLWTEQDEEDLLRLLDRLIERKIPFALSNVLANKGKIHSRLLMWLFGHSADIRIHPVKSSYANSNYHGHNKDKQTLEVLVTNY